MASRTFDVIDICEILVHWYAGRSKNEVADRLGMARNTVRGYVAPPEAAGLCPGGPEISGQQCTERCGSGSRSWSTPGCGR